MRTKAKATMLRGGLCWRTGAVTAVLLIAAADSARGAEVGRPIGTALLYQVDPASLAIPQQGPDDELMESLVKALNKRINTGWWKKARIQRQGKDKIEVGIYGADAENAARIKRLIERAGTLEFRVLANDRDHKDLVDRAKQEKSTVVRAAKKDEQGEQPVLGRWVPLQEGTTDADKNRVQTMLAYPGIATRTVKEGEREVRQVLIAKDEYNVDGRFLAEASAGVDFRGMPCVNFRLSKEGGRRFAALTGNNLPEQGGEFTRKLGIILDGRLFSAPAIQSTISDRGEITGSFSKLEVQELVDVLNAGALPARLLPPVYERVLKTEKPQE